GQGALAAVTLSMFAVPALTALGARIGRSGVSPLTLDNPAPAVGHEPRVLVVGYGRVGRLVAEMLTRHDKPWTAIEREPRGVEAARRQLSANAHADIYFGDAARPELLRRCGLETAT
ncbi:NAD-binding protein, partial [Mycobacterium tuberculosis]